MPGKLQHVRVGIQQTADFAVRLCFESNTANPGRVRLAFLPEHGCSGRPARKAVRRLDAGRGLVEIIVLFGVAKSGPRHRPDDLIGFKPSITLKTVDKMERMIMK